MYNMSHVAEGEDGKTERLKLSWGFTSTLYEEFAL